MPKVQSVMILGSGRLAYRLSKLFKEKGINVVEISSKEFKEMEETEVQESSIDYARELLIQKGIESFSAICIVDGEDAVNIFLLMAVLAVREDIPIYATFFNESLISGMALQYRNLKIFNPAAIVSKLFVEKIPKTISKNEEVETSVTYPDSPSDNLNWWLGLGFIGLIISGTLFFRITESTDWLRGFYLFITLITSVNFGDAEIANYSSKVQILRSVMMFIAYAYVPVALAFIVDQRIKRRTDILMLGRRRYKNRGHIIVCGLGRVGYAIVQDLIIKGEDIIVIESNPDNIYLPIVRSRKIPVLIGDAIFSHYLIDAGIGRAKALICAINGDVPNLLIGLNARSENNNIRLLLRIFDKSAADEMKKRFNINYVFSKSHSTAQAIYDRINSLLKSSQKPVVKRVQI